MQAQPASLRPLRVFLCHASEDKPVVEPLNQRLQECNIDSWLDIEKLLPGQNWELEIRKAVRAADVVIVCLSNISINKEGFVQREVKLALKVAEEKPIGSIFIIPLKLEACQVPDELSHIHFVDFFEKDGFDSLMRALESKRQSLNVAVAPIKYKASRKLSPTLPNPPSAAANSQGNTTQPSGLGRTRVNRALIGVLILALIGSGFAALIQTHVLKLPFGGQATTVTSTPTNPNILYQANFSQGSQKWLNDNHSQQWTYNDIDKVLQSDGTMPCCTPTTELEQTVLNAPTTFTTTNYTIEARMKTLGNNPFNPSQPPFFGIFFRGYALNGNGYMAGIIASKPNANTKPFSFLLVQEPNKLLKRDDEVPYDLDTQWHTYWVMVQGNTYTFFIDQKQLYSMTLPQYFTSGPEIGIEDYGYTLQIQYLNVYHFCTPYKNCSSVPPTASSSSTSGSTASPSTNRFLCNSPKGTEWIVITQFASCSQGVLMMQQDTKYPDYAQVNLANVSGSPLNLTQFHVQVQANFIGNPNDPIFGNTVAAFYIQIPRTPQNIVGYVFELYPNSNNTKTFTGPSWDIESVNLKGINADGTTLVKHGQIATGNSKVITTATMALTIQGQEVTFSIGGIQETTFLLDSPPIAFGLVVGEQHTGGDSSIVHFSQFKLS